MSDLITPWKQNQLRPLKLASLQTLEAALGQQTVGLVTRAEFAEKQRTLQEQIAAHQDKRKRDELEAANKVCKSQNASPVLPASSDMSVWCASVACMPLHYCTG